MIIKVVYNFADLNSSLHRFEFQSTKVMSLKDLIKSVSFDLDVLFNNTYIIPHSNVN